MTTTTNNTYRDHVSEEAADAAQDALIARGIDVEIHPDHASWDLTWTVYAPHDAFDCHGCGGDGGWDEDGPCRACRGTGVAIDL